MDESLEVLGALWLEIGAKAAAVVERDREMATVTIFIVMGDVLLLLLLVLQRRKMRVEK